MGRKFWQALLTWVVLAALLFGAKIFSAHDLVSGAASEIQGRTLEGRSFAGLGGLPKPLVIYFWASGCPVCRAMQGAVREISQEAPLISIAMQSGSAAEVAQYMKKTGFEVPVVLDESGAIGRSYGLRGVPAVFVLDSAGGIRYATRGYTNALGLRLRLWLAGHKSRI